MRATVFLMAALGWVLLWADDVLDRVPPQWRARVRTALKTAGPNRAELEKALREASDQTVRIVAWLIGQSPYRYTGGLFNEKVPDARKLSADFLKKWAENVLKTRRWPWTSELDEEKFLRFVTAYRNTTEKIEDWRTLFLADKELVAKVEEFAKRYREAKSKTENRSRWRSG